jgi:hypothetical protein
LFVFPSHQASVDGFNWITLREHVNDQAINERGASYTWNIVLDEEKIGPYERPTHVPPLAFSSFRIVQTGVRFLPAFPSSIFDFYTYSFVVQQNSNQHYYLAVSGFEVYGTLYWPTSDGSPYSFPTASELAASSGPGGSSNSFLSFSSSSSLSSSPILSQQTGKPIRKHSSALLTNSPC